MKRLILLIALLLPIGVMAAEPITSKISDKYGNTDGVTVVNLEGAMLQAMIASEADSVEEAAEAAKYLDALKVITCENKAVSAKLRKDIDKLIKRSNLQSLIDIPKEGIKIYTHGENGAITGIIVYVTEEVDVTLVEISGNFPSELMDELLGTMISM